MRRSLPAVATLVAVAFLTSACSGSASDTATEETTSEQTSSSPTESSPTDETSPTEETSPTDETTETEDSEPDDDGQTLSGQGYNASLPSGWQNVTQEAKQRQPLVDIAVAEAKASDFRTNINVVQPNPAPEGLSDDQLAQQAARELKTVTKTKVRRLPGVEFSGEPSIGQTSTTQVQGSSVSLVQYLVIHAGKIYAVTLSFESSRAAEAKQALDEFVGSWTWTS